jgi:BirA family biotin operon repressor/biotin-[acetyl-CoA-carboxylase] ligase
MDARDPALEQRIAQVVNGARLGTPCHAFAELPSTMDAAHQLAADGAPEGTCVWAEQQTGGRGRAGRTWSSPPGGLYLSLILRPAREVREIPQLALVAGLAVAQTIYEVTGLWTSLRWPNDVLLNEQKVAGILVEASTSETRDRRPET